MKHSTLPVLFLILALVATGCAPPPTPHPAATVTAPPTATPTASPTFAPTQTAPATLTPTPPPSATPLPTATPLPAPGLHAYSTQVEYLSGTARLQTTLRYLLFFPADYGKDPVRKWPLILFLHGSGEAGENLDRVKRNGLPALVEQQADFPFVVVAPQIPAPVQNSNQVQTDANTYIRTWGWSKAIDPLNALLEKIETAYAIDRSRVYLTGLSLGGFGAWEYALRYPTRFAAVAPIAGGYYYEATKAPSNICKLKDLPIWAFHGDQDESVPYTDTQVLVDALEACGGAVKFTLYPGGSHADAWEKAYAGPELYEWLLEHTRR